MRRPLVIVTGPDRGGSVAWWMTALAILRAGGRPRRVTPRRPSLESRLDALVLGGGADVDPEHYEEAAAAGGELRTHVEDPPPERRGIIGPALLAARTVFARPFSGLDAARDDLERRLLDEAARAGAPVLGICRGAQLMNVHYGGTLYPSLKEFYVELPQLRTVLPRKEVALEPASRLSTIVEAPKLLVNALHRQAVRTLGRGLRVVAREPSGVVQAIEDSSHPFRIGVQWHPELLPQIEEQQRLFEALVRAA